jgi:hypothetical protein
MAGPNPSFEDLVASVSLETFSKVDVIYGFAEPFQEAWEEIIGEKP